MNPSESAPHITHPIADVDTKFNKLSIDDIFNKILPQDRKQRKTAMVENLKLAGVTGSEAYGELQGFDEEVPTFDDFIKYSNTAQGQLVIVTHAFGAANPDAKTFSPSIDEVRGAWIKLGEACGIVFTKIGPPKDEADVPTDAQEGSDPNAGAAYGK